MRTWRFHEPGDIRNLILEETDKPVPGPDEALVTIHCAALNPADRYLVQGQYPRSGTPPFTPGRDGAGIILQPASGGRFKAGDKVCILGGLTGVSRPGTLAEYCPVPEGWLAPVPANWTFEQAAAAPLVHLTAWRALVICGGLTGADTVLITGASGGVGTAAIFLAKARGARVIALSRSKSKRKTLEAMGADYTLDSGSPSLEQEVRQAAGEKPVSLILDTLGGPFLEKCARIIAAHGRILVVGLLADLKSEITLGLLIHKNLRLQGLSVSAFTPNEIQDAWVSILECYENSSKRPLISRIFPMEDVQDAFGHLHAGPLGKVVIRISEHRAED